MNGMTRYLVFIPGVARAHESMAATATAAVADAIYTLGLPEEPPGVYVTPAGLVDVFKKEPECSSAT